MRISLFWFSILTGSNFNVLYLGLQESIFTHPMDFGYALGNRLDLEAIFFSLEMKDPPTAVYVCQHILHSLLFRTKVLEMARHASRSHFPVFVDHHSFIVPIVIGPDFSDASLVAAVTARLDILVGGETGPPLSRRATS